jgi:hypothetical protein
MSEQEDKKTVSPEFINTVKKYLELDDKLKENREIIKKMTSDKKDKEDFILNYLKTIEETVIDVRDGKLRRNISKTQAPLKKEMIHKTLTEIVGDAIKAQSMTDQIIKSRPMVERVTLKRTKNKVSQDGNN